MRSTTSSVYDGVTFTSIASLSPEIKAHTILINGVSKSYAMTGWRIGYLAAEPEVVKVISRYVSHSTGNPSAACSGRCRGSPVRPSGGRGDHAPGL